MKTTIIVYGPKGCGKTTNAALIASHFGCESIIDNWIPGDVMQEGALHLTHADISLEARGSAVPAYSYGAVMTVIRKALSAPPAIDSKPTNPKDGVGIRKWRQFVTIPFTVNAEVGTAMLEGGMKYGRHNYRVAGVRASVYVDAAIGHVMQWWEGEDLDPDTKLSHITKAIASLVVLRDAMIQNMLTDDRPPKAKLDDVRQNLQRVVDEMFDKYPEPKLPFTEVGEAAKRVAEQRAVLSDLCSEMGTSSL